MDTCDARRLQEPVNALGADLVEDGEDPMARGDVATGERAIGDAPENKESADGHQIDQVAKGSEQRDDGCSAQALRVSHR